MYKTLLAILVCLTVVRLVPRATAQAGDIAVIVNPDNSSTNVSLADLRKLFAGEKRTWPGSGTPIRLFVRAPGSHERTVLLQLLGMSETEYKQHWTAQIFRGDADSEPMAIASFGIALEAVRTFRGAICFVEARDIRPGISLKVIKVDGRMPGDPGYPLH